MENGRRDIEVADTTVYSQSCTNAIWIADDQRDLKGSFIEAVRVLEIISVFEALTVVGGQHDHGFARIPQPIEILQQSADPEIGVLHFATVITECKVIDI